MYGEINRTMNYYSVNMIAGFLVPSTLIFCREFTWYIYNLPAHLAAQPMVHLNIQYNLFILVILVFHRLLSAWKILLYYLTGNKTLHIKHFAWDFSVLKIAMLILYWGSRIKLSVTFYIIYITYMCASHDFCI